MPTALTSKSSNGRDLARSCDGWAAQWMIRSGRVSSNDAGHRLAVADVQRAVLEVAAGLLEVAEVPGGVAAGAEEVGPHVVVDPEDL